MIFSKVNELDPKDFFEFFQHCCGSKLWLEQLSQARPFDSLENLLNTSATIWQTQSTTEKLAAFSHHPQIGDLESLQKKYQNQHTDWSKQEQNAASTASNEELRQLKLKNEEYFQKYGFIFIICASGKSVAEMLIALDQRLKNDREQEIINAAMEQEKITAIRIKKLFS